ncbi:MAG: prolyl oligopeptidase family serine peptidase [Myxococcota bacterium]
MSRLCPLHFTARGAARRALGAIPWSSSVRWAASVAAGLAVSWACSSPASNDGPAPGPDPSAPSSSGSRATGSASRGPERQAAATSGYRMPSADVVDIVDAPPTPLVNVAPGGQRLGHFTYQALPGIDVVTRPFERLAGIRVDAERHRRRRTRWITEISLQQAADGAITPVVLPPGARVSHLQWSPDGQRLAFTRDSDDGLELWVAGVDGKAQRLGSVIVNDMLGSPYEWMPGSQSLLVRQVPPGRGPAPVRPSVPAGPVVEDTAGKAATNRTYQDLLRSADDEALFEYFATSRLAFVDLRGTTRPLGEPDLVDDIEPSPDGKHVLVQRLRRPFSYAVPYTRFARVLEVLDAKAKVVRRVADQDVADEIPIQGVRTGPRMAHWQPGHPATLVWVEALDGGDPRKTVEHRDRVMSHAAPFADTPEERLRVTHRLWGLEWTQSPGQVLVSEYDRDRRWTTTRLHALDDPAKAPRVLFDRSTRDVYADPGDPITEVRPDGTEVVIVADGQIFLAGQGASPKGDRPFLDRYDLATGRTERLMQSQGQSHTEFVDFVGEGHDALLVRRESVRDTPNFFVLGPDGERQLTHFPDPHPQLTGIRKQILTYERRDGVPLSGTLYLPPSYEEGQTLPLVVWAYPLEYNDGDTAGQVRAAPRTFTRLRGTSPLMFLTQGYAVLGNAAMPVVGDPQTMNDTFVEQIVWAAEAAIDAVVEAGVADRDRVGVGGHSYGAFMTANLLAHSDLFRAGTARSGAYNRTLTPFGFQSERRTLWEAPEVYRAVSPLFAADRLDEPLLLVHGEVDNNAGTYPLQSRRLFHALKGTGGTARLVMLPGESHGYVARESVLHVLAESFEWFDTHVKNAEPRARGKATTTVANVAAASGSGAPPSVGTSTAAGRSGADKAEPVASGSPAASAAEPSAGAKGAAPDASTPSPPDKPAPSEPPPDKPAPSEPPTTPPAKKASGSSAGAAPGSASSSGPGSGKPDPPVPPA